MLKHIHIRNFAVAETLNTEFQPGLNIITGETGTGKSIVVGAISAVLGGRVFTEVVRTGAEKATVEAVFNISKLPGLKKLLEDKGLEAGDELFLRREISIKGSTRAFVNDTPVTITTLSEIGDHLVDIHGQNEHQSLLHRETHRYFLDAFGQLGQVCVRVAEDYRKLREAERQLQELEERKKSLEEKYELYQFQINEIDKMNLKAGEELQLESERNILANTEKIFSLSEEFNRVVTGDSELNLQELMGQALHSLRELAEFSANLNSIYQEFSSAKIIVEEAARSVEEFQSSMEYDPARLETVEQRLAAISALKKKYGSTIEAILQHRDQIQNELQLKENFDFELSRLQKIYQQQIKDYGTSARKLSDQRKKTSRRLEQQVISLLQAIGMPKTRFQVQLNMQEDKNGLYQENGQWYYGDENGIDQIEFYISPNPGEDYKPLNKIASGGEISRIMLALKNILAEIDRIPLLIFDEIDAGVSGRIALSVGKSIHNLANSHQILCITHLPQIASFGNAHFRVEKYVQNSRTFTRMIPLTGDIRVEEIARLMGGKQMTDAILQSARQLLGEAEASRTVSR